MLFANERPTPPKVVVWSLPVESAESRVFVALLKIVELLKVDVELIVSPPVKVWPADQVTDEAAVTNPGFTKLMVTAPVDPETLMFVPETLLVTPEFVRTLFVRFNPVLTEVVPKTPDEFAKTSELVTPPTVTTPVEATRKTVELLFWKAT